MQRIPAWSTNLTKRVVSRPKAALLDTGLTARLLGVSAAGAAPAVQPEIAGHLLEGFVAGELRRQQGWAEALVPISHYRDHAGDEVDLILETDATSSPLRRPTFSGLPELLQARRPVVESSMLRQRYDSCISFVRGRLIVGRED